MRVLQWAIFVGPLLALSAGCAPHHDLIAAGLLRLEQLPPNDASLRAICAHERDEGLAITGTWRNRLSRGHVDVALLGPDGEVLAEARTRLTTLPHRRHGHPARFSVQLPVFPPPGSTLRVTRHDGEHDE